jgi:hypothetical protein
MSPLCPSYQHLPWARLRSVVPAGRAGVLVVERSSAAAITKQYDPTNLFQLNHNIGLGQ